MIITGSEILIIRRGSLFNTSSNSQPSGTSYVTSTCLTTRMTTSPGSSRPQEFILQHRPIGRNSWAVQRHLESALSGRPGHCPKQSSSPGSLHKIASGPQTGWLNGAGTIAPLAHSAEQQLRHRTTSCTNADTPEKFGTKQLHGWRCQAYALPTGSQVATPWNGGPTSRQPQPRRRRQCER